MRIAAPLPVSALAPLLDRHVRRKTHMSRVCLFDRLTGASVEDWPDDALAARVAHAGKIYHRYRLSLLSSARMVDEATVYTTGPLTPADEFVVFRALFPNRGGVFQIEKSSD
jgi:hypothetical protein